MLFLCNNELTQDKIVYTYTTYREMHTLINAPSASYMRGSKLAGQNGHYLYSTQYAEKEKRERKHFSCVIDPNADSRGGSISLILASLATTPALSDCRKTPLI